MTLTNYRYSFVTRWSLDAPIERLWDELYRPLDWPLWWKGVSSVEQLACGDADGLHSRYRFTMRSRLPYALKFEMETTRLDRPYVIEGSSSGELVGTGIWTLARTTTGTAIRYDWTVEVTKPWMRALSSFARPVFAWNHGVIMRWGLEGLRRRVMTSSQSPA